MRARALESFAAVLCAGALLSAFVVSFSGAARILYWAVVILLAIAAAAVAKRRGAGLLDSFRPAPGEFLCDSCKYNDPRYCRRPERPNASRCEDYKRR
jgi:hypothetical protein